MSGHDQVHELSLSICENRMRIRAVASALRDSIARKLWQHASARDEGSDDRAIDLRLYTGADGRLNAVLSDPLHSYETSCAFEASSRLQEHDDRLYYKVVLPMLSVALSRRGYVRLHAAAMWSERTGLVLILGPSGSGKTTSALSWLLEGGVVLGDDIAFVRRAGELYECGGIRRAFNLAPDTVRRHDSLPEIREARPYLPGRSKVAYDAWKHLAGDGCGARLYRSPLLVLSEVDASNAISVLTPAPVQAVEQTLREASYVSPDDPIAASLSPTAVLAQLADCRALAARWGTDVFSGERTYIETLRAAVEQ